MTKTSPPRDRSKEMQVYISKSHHAMLKEIAETDNRTIRATLELWIDHHLAMYEPK